MMAQNSLSCMEETVDVSDSGAHAFDDSTMFQKALTPPAGTSRKALLNLPNNNEGHTNIIIHVPNYKVLCDQSVWNRWLSNSPTSTVGGNVFSCVEICPSMLMELETVSTDLSHVHQENTKHGLGVILLQCYYWTKRNFQEFLLQVALYNTSVISIFDIYSPSVLNGYGLLIPRNGRPHTSMEYGSLVLTKSIFQKFLLFFALRSAPKDYGSLVLTKGNSDTPMCALSILETFTARNKNKSDNLDCSKGKTARDPKLTHGDKRSSVNFHTRTNQTFVTSDTVELEEVW
jgi:hypothetical protein